MSIKYVTQQTWKKVYEPVNKEPSLTRDDDYESIESLFARFTANFVKPISRMTAEEKLAYGLTVYGKLDDEQRETLENSTDVEDLDGEDLSVIKDFIDYQQEQLKSFAKSKKVEKDEPKQAKNETDSEPSDEKADGE